MFFDGTSIIQTYKSGKKSFEIDDIKMLEVESNEQTNPSDEKQNQNDSPVLTDDDLSDNLIFDSDLLTTKLQKTNQIKLNTFENLFSAQNKDTHHGIVICGHRGGCGKTEPENTIRAFKKSLDMGLKCIEYDVSTILYRMVVPDVI